MRDQRVKIVLLLLSLLVLGIAFVSCSESDENNGTSHILGITGVSIPSEIRVMTGGEMTLTGKGLMLNDEIALILQGQGEEIYTSQISTVTNATFSFPLPSGIATGTYLLKVIRNGQSLSLGMLKLEVSANNHLSDREGMTVKGVVSCAGVGVRGVIVSDGYEVAATDKQGIYYLPSAKESGFVFISVPGNYEIGTDLNHPLFYQRLTGGQTVEQKDFQLTKVDNNKHVLLTMADLHLAKRNDDITQFETGFLKDVNALITSYRMQGTKVYGLTLGDLSWDLYWYDNLFALPETMKEIQKVECPVFNTMGNHDNNPYLAADWLASQTYRKVMGPTYYSFNLGAVHYVVLDDIEYINTGASQGVIGDRNYNGVVAAEQIAWLKKDLAMLEDKSVPVVLAIHIPMYANPTTVDGQGNQTDRISLRNGSELLACLDGFANVHVLSGHTHINFSVEASESIMEHNTAAVCATWWWTGKSGYAGNHICKDGSPGGYGVWEMEDNRIEWYYKSIGYDRSYQFRSYDRNTILINAPTFAPGATGSNITALATYAGTYAQADKSNEILLNIWGYDLRWKVEVTENGIPLTVTRVVAKDPLHIISYEAQRLNVNATPTEDFVTSRTAHLFKATASAPNTTLVINVTDRFGNVFTEQMTRPKVFNCTMK